MGKLQSASIPPAEAVPIFFESKRISALPAGVCKMEHDFGRVKIFYREKVLTASTCSRHCVLLITLQTTVGVLCLLGDPLVQDRYQ